MKEHDYETDIAKNRAKKKRRKAVKKRRIFLKTAENRFGKFTSLFEYLSKDIRKKKPHEPKNGNL